MVQTFGQVVETELAQQELRLDGPMLKKITLQSIAEQLLAMDTRMQKGFAAVAHDIAHLRRELKGDIVAFNRATTPRD